MPGGAVARRAILVIAAAALFVIPAHAQNAADRIAETFAGEAERAQARKAEAARKAADEVRSKRQAERKAAQALRVLEIRRRAEAQRAEAVARRKAEETRAAEEEEMLARARQEADEAGATAEIRRLIDEAEAARLRAEETLAQDARHAPASTGRLVGTEPQQEMGLLGSEAEQRAQQAEADLAKAAERARLTALRIDRYRQLVAKLARVGEVRRARLAGETRRLAEQAEAARIRIEEKAARLALARTIENRRLVKQLARVPRLRHARLAAQGQRSAQTAEIAFDRAPEQARLEGRISERPASATVTGRVGLGGEPDWRVTVLMIMTPGTYGIRRGANTADPVLCTIDGCYVSAGADWPARFFPRRKALGFGNTFGGRAGACRQSLGCVFRGVALHYPGVLQPVDLHILKHDRRRPQRILADSDCQLIDGRLICRQGIYAEDYVMWIVPERLADMAGPEALERALRRGLNASRSADLSGGPLR